MSAFCTVSILASSVSVIRRKVSDNAIHIHSWLGSSTILILTLFLSLQATAQTLLPGPNIGDKGSVTFYYQNQKVTYMIVRAADSNVWLQQNLGASKVADSLKDVASYGDYFQWGRWDDGHQLRTVNSSKPAYSLSSNNPSGLNFCADSFITSPNPSGSGSLPPYWWRDGDQTNTWNNNPPSGTNGFSPCALLGDSWHLGDSTEWANILIMENMTNLADAFASNLKLPACGYKSGRTGRVSSEGSSTIKGFWTSTATPQYTGTPESGGYYAAPSIYGNTLSSSYAQNGFSIRCVLSAGAEVNAGISGPDTLCLKGDATLFSMPALGIATSYVWKLPEGWKGESDSNSISIIPEPGAGYISVYAFNHCGDTVAMRTKEVLVAHVAPIINVNGFVLGTTESYSSYQWLKDGKIIEGATSQTYTVNENADYQVIVTSDIGCSDTSPVYTVTNIQPPLSIQGNNAGTNIRIYPNPSHDVISVSVPAHFSTALFTVEGRRLARIKGAGTFDIRTLNSGIYFLEVRDQDSRLIKTEKIMKQ